MIEDKGIRLSKVVKLLNIGSQSIVECLRVQGISIENNPNIKITVEQYEFLKKFFGDGTLDKDYSKEQNIEKKNTYESTDSIFSNFVEKKEVEIPKLFGVSTIGKIDLNNFDKEKLKGTQNKVAIQSDDYESIKISEISGITDSPAEKNEDGNKNFSTIGDVEGSNEKKDDSINKVELNLQKLKGIDFVGKIDMQQTYDKLSNKNKVNNTNLKGNYFINTPKKGTSSVKRGASSIKKILVVEEKKVSDVEDKLKNRLAKIMNSSTFATTRSQIKRKKRKELSKDELEKNDVLEMSISEFSSPSDIAFLLDLDVTEIISKCMDLGTVVSINQRLDSELISVILDEYGYKANFGDIKQEDVDIDDLENLVERPPIVTVMGHVDHGKTSFLDYLQNINTVLKESGGITQHIGAYSVKTPMGKYISFIDTPGHEAFTAMRARGAKITDIVVIIIAADDGVNQQTKEAILHAQGEGVPIIIAINKVDKITANVEKVKEQLSNINILVEDWGGKYQCECISSKTGFGVDNLLQKILLQAAILELRANPNKSARGVVLEASFERGRGFISTVVIENGTLNIGDSVVVGAYYGRVKSMKTSSLLSVKSALPSSAVMVMGINGAPQAGDILKVVDSERAAKALALQRQQLSREQSARVRKHITLNEIGRRLALGNFNELNVIVKGDVDGSIEALADSLIKLSTESFKVDIISKGVGDISESDVLMASASHAIIVGFRVRPSSAARQLATVENVEIVLHSVIYDSIDSIKNTMKIMLGPQIDVVVVATLIVKAVFKISKVGLIAGCVVSSGIIKSTNKIRLIRDNEILHIGLIKYLKREKEVVKEVKKGIECGLSIQNFSNIKEGDLIEAFEEKEV